MSTQCDLIWVRLVSNIFWPAISSPQLSNSSSMQDFFSEQVISSAGTFPAVLLGCDRIISLLHSDSLDNFNSTDTRARAGLWVSGEKSDKTLNQEFVNMLEAGGYSPENIDRIHTEYELAVNSAKERFPQYFPGASSVAPSKSTSIIHDTSPSTQNFEENRIDKTISTLTEISGPFLNQTICMEIKARTKKRDDVLQWDDYFMAVAFLSALRSKDPSTQVGACIVNSEKKIVGIGYNGFPRG